MTPYEKIGMSCDDAHMKKQLSNSYVDVCLLRVA